MNMFTRPPQRGRRPDCGVAVVTVLYGLSLFSAVSLTVLRSPELEKTLQTSEDPDLHVVLYAGGANSRTTIARLNLPTTFRTEGTPDKSTEVRIPGAPHLDLASELAPGWAYAVRLSPHARVCCDGGDNACAAVTWDEEIASGALTPTLSAPLRPRDGARQLRFALSSMSVPKDVSLDPTATAASAFLVRATRTPEASPPGAPANGYSEMTCRLESGAAEVATAVLRIQPGLDENRAVTRISDGILELHYKGGAAAGDR